MAERVYFLTYCVTDGGFMYGIGTDIVTISRIEKSLERESFLHRVYGEKEIELFASGAKVKTASLAANFAAKEAFGKALGTGVRGFEFYEVQVLRDLLGKPYFELSGSAKEIADRENVECLVSLSHENDRAIAFVVMEKKADKI